MTKAICIPNHTLKDTLQGLLERAGILSGSELAKKVNLPVPTINRLLAGTVSDPRTSTLLQLAEYFNVTVDQLLGNTPLPHSLNSSEQTYSQSIRIPMFGLADIILESNVTRVKNQFYNYSIDNKSELGTNNLFAVEINNDQFSPVFSQGTILIVNKAILPPAHNDYILIKLLEANTITVKRFFIDPPFNYFVPLRPNLATIKYIAEEHELIGIVQEAHTQLK